jgi:hypothetical protein
MSQVVQQEALTRLLTDGEGGESGDKERKNKGRLRLSGMAKILEMDKVQR